MKSNFHHTFKKRKKKKQEQNSTPSLPRRIPRYSRARSVCRGINELIFGASPGVIFKSDRRRAHGGVVTISFKTDFRQSTPPPPWRRQWNTRCSPRTTATTPPRCWGRRGCSRPSWPRPRVRPRRQRRRPPYPRRSSSSSRREGPGHTQRHAQGWWDCRVRNKSKPVYILNLNVFCVHLFLPVIGCCFTR